MLGGGPAHTSYSTNRIQPPFRLAWARHFPRERLGTAMEPIVADGRVFLATHAGAIAALDAESGELRWRRQGDAPFLQSPAWGGGLVVAADVCGSVYALEAATGQIRWSRPAPGGFAAAPAVDNNVLYLGTRTGQFLAISLTDGMVRWRAEWGVPIRQTAAVVDGHVYVTAEDLRVRCLEAATGAERWTSTPLAGQSARDYYPVVVTSGNGRRYVIVRTNPTLNMAQRISRDRQLLARNAGADDNDWRKLDAWLKSDAARGNEELWRREQEIITTYLRERREAQSFFILDAETGKETSTAPVLWIGGCQGVGAPPAVTASGELLVFHRSAYGNWNQGVAPMVALGLLDPGANRIRPLFHRQGAQPPWNHFWGTADESQHFQVAGTTALIVHQGTLSGFDLESRNLFPIWGDRDTYGGLPNPSWARNEWHGPGRGGVAVVGRRLYWLTGSRILCLVWGESGPRAGDLPVAGSGPADRLARATDNTAELLAECRTRLVTAVEEILSREWAPLFVQPGLAGREFFFEQSGDLFDALAWAWPHLPPALQAAVAARLDREWTRHPPFTPEAWYPLNAGERRELFAVPAESLSRLGPDRPFHPFGNVAAVRRYAERCGQRERVVAVWPKIRSAFDDWRKTNWRLDPARGDLHANRYLNSLMATAAVAEWAGDPETAQAATRLLDESLPALVAAWNRAASEAAPGTFRGAGELDPFIGGGKAFFFRVAPHRHKIALFHELSPELAQRVRDQTRDSVTTVWDAFQALEQTWWVVGEERQVHFGENYVDTPDLARDGFGALAWLQGAPPEALARRVDLPFCRADLFHLVKLALALDVPEPSL